MNTAVLNLDRYTIFSNASIFADLDFGLDLSFEHRRYGGVVGPKGAVLYGDSSHTENGAFPQCIALETHSIL